MSRSFGLVLACRAFGQPFLPGPGVDPQFQPVLEHGARDQAEA